MRRQQSSNGSEDERAVSVAVTHALTIAITTVLVSGLLIASGGLLDTQKQHIGQDQLEEIGSDATSHIDSFDRMNQKAADVETAVEPEYPHRVVESYRYEFHLHDNGDYGTLEISSDQLGVSAEFDIETATELRESSVSGNDVEISLCEGEEITLGGCDS